MRGEEEYDQSAINAFIDIGILAITADQKSTGRREEIVLIEYACGAEAKPAAAIVRLSYRETKLKFDDDICNMYIAKKAAKPTLLIKRKPKLVSI